jgi:hypothetical protein
MTKSFRGQEVPKDSVKSEPLVVKSLHNAETLSCLTKKEIIEYAHKYGIAVNSRKKKEELISIILRS